MLFSLEPVRNHQHLVLHESIGIKLFGVVSLCDSFSIVVVRMASIYCQCLGKAGKVCSRILPAMDKDLYALYQLPW